MSQPEHDLSRALLAAFRPDFGERDASARQAAELILDAVSAALPLTRHDPSDAALAELENLAQQTDVYAWDGAPGWDVVLARGLVARSPVPAGPSLLDGIGVRAERTQQRGELKRRAHAEAERLVALSRTAAQDGSAEELVAAHASVLRLVGLASAAPLLLLPEDAAAGAPPEPRTGELLREMEARGEGFAIAQEEWLARLLADNPAAQAPHFRTFYAGLSQSLRIAPSLASFAEDADAGQLAADAEAILGALGTWQPVRWSSLRAGVPSAWIAAFCPQAPAGEAPLRRLARESRAALDAFSALWSAKGLPLSAFAALASLFTARCAGVVALWEELGGGAPPP